MSDEVKETPAVVVPVEPKEKPAKVEPAKDEAWIGERLERGRTALLKEMGFPDIESAKAAGKAAHDAAEAKKTSEEKAAELTTKLTSTETERQRLLAIATEHAGRMLGVLTPEQQAAVRNVAGDDPALQLKAIGAFGPTWAKEAAAVVPSSSAPAKDAPAAVVPGAPPDHKTEYKTRKQTNPFAAAAYGLQNETDVYKP